MDLTKLHNTGLQYDNLTDEQELFFLTHIWNGVGSREFFIDPHDLIFKIPSMYHDFYYFGGGDEERRQMSDWDFYLRCKREVLNISWWKRPFLYSAAYIYYFFLKIGGKYAFEYTDKPAETWEEYMEIVNSYLIKSGKEPLIYK